ncbi:hypothetical protein APHAL10511_008126 [Amanita phalloides]|nr:hypothetical protein APHAL10511_008126 [Amanita phalloides]
MPVVTPSSSMSSDVIAWEEKEDLAMYLLLQKLPDSIFAKYMRKSSVTEIWAAIVVEFTQKSMLMKANLHMEFMAQCYMKGTNLWEEFDHVCMKYKQLLNADVAVSNDDYHTLVLNFVPGNLSTFLVQISANMKILALALSTTAGTTSTIINAKRLMQIAIEEWE